MIDRELLEEKAKQAVASNGDVHDMCLYDLWDTIDSLSDADLVEIIRTADPALLDE